MLRETKLADSRDCTVSMVIGLFNAFMSNYKADYFQKIVDGLTDRQGNNSLWNFALWCCSFCKLWNELFG